MDEQTLKVFHRISQSGDGIDYLNYLKQAMEDINTEFRVCDPNLNNVVKGKAIAINKLIKDFEQAADRLAKLDIKEKEWV